MLSIYNTQTNLEANPQSHDNKTEECNYISCFQNM